jgi:hypothetical protein
MSSADVVRWRKSSHSDSSGGSCVEVGLLAPVATAEGEECRLGNDSRSACNEVASVISLSPGEWRKSSRSDSSGAECVEVVELASAVAVRDSKDPDGPKLVFEAAAWEAFAGQVKGGHLDLS